MVPIMAGAVEGNHDMTNEAKLEQVRFAMSALTALGRTSDGGVIIGPVGWDILLAAREALAQPARAEG
jgi:hypothetical protein